MLMSTEFLVFNHLYSTASLHVVYYYLNNFSDCSNHLHNNNYNVYNLCHLLSRLLLLPIVIVESTVTIYCSYCVIYVDFYCQTQGKELFICGKICTCFLVFSLLSLRNLSKSYLLLNIEFKDLSKSHLISLLILKISLNLLFVG